MKYLEPGTIVATLCCMKGRYNKVTGAPYFDASAQGLYYPTIPCTASGKEFKRPNGLNVKWLHNNLKKYPNHFKIVVAI